MTSSVVKEEGVAIGSKDKGDAENFGVLKCLLHSVADAVVVVLGLDQRQRAVRLVQEDVIGAFPQSPCDEFAADNDSALREADLLANLRDDVPPGLLDCGRDELRADVALAECFLVHVAKRPRRNEPRSGSGEKCVL